MNTESLSRKGIKDIFYETRVLMGRQYTLRRFAQEVLGGSVEPVMLGYIEKGTRFPTEALVRRLAAIRQQEPNQLLALLWRDRMLHAFGRELQRVLEAPEELKMIEDADLAVLISEGLSALPDDGSWMPLSDWRQALDTLPGQRRTRSQTQEEMIERTEQTLRERNLVEIHGDEIRRLGRHFSVETLEERQSLAIQLAALFFKGLLDKLALPTKDTGTYLRSHFLNIDPERLPEFQRRLHQTLTELAIEFDQEPTDYTEFLNILVTSTRP